MGQKIHPTGFRIGITQKHSSTWCVHHSVFSDVLKEDYKIRRVFENEFFKHFPKAGIARLEINKKVNNLELLIYAVNPNSLEGKLDKRENLRKLKSNLKKVITKPKKIQIKVLQIHEFLNESSIVIQLLADEIKKRIPFRQAIRKMAGRLRVAGVEGFKIQVSGRLDGAEMARAEWVREGRVPLQTLRANISYSTQGVNTIYGVLGLKVWIFNGEII